MRDPYVCAYEEGSNETMYTKKGDMCKCVGNYAAAIRKMVAVSETGITVECVINHSFHGC